jgi:hypothetical protein
MQKQYLIGGVVAGLVGGLAMAVYTMTNEFLSGHSIFTPMCRRRPSWEWARWNGA